MKIEDPTWVKTDLFTLSFEDLTGMRNVEVEVDPVRRASRRARVMEQTVAQLLAENTERLRKKLGQVKMFTFHCAENYNWTEADYTLNRFEKKILYF